MTQDTQHHEDVAVVTLHFHEDELLAFAELLLPAVADGRTSLPQFELAAAAILRVTSAADGVIHAARAKRRAPKA